MTEVWRARLHAQGLATPSFGAPADVVGHLGAVQAQEYRWSRWALGSRMGDGTDADVDVSLARGDIVRTHVLRPTWHYVLPEELPWLMAATVDRVRRLNAYQNRQAGLDDALLDRCADVIVAALAGGATLTRRQLGEHLEAAGIETGSGQRLGYIVHHAELECLVVSGPLAGRQHTYRLLTDLVPEPATPPVDEARIRLARTYVTGHGPARAEDLAWWSSLTLTQARAAVRDAGLRETTIDGVDYVVDDEPQQAHPDTVLLLPPYDEYISYAVSPRDSTLTGFGLATDRWAGGYVIADGLIRGNWFREQTAERQVVDIRLAAPLRAAQRRRLFVAADAFAAFSALDTDVRIDT